MQMLQWPPRRVAAAVYLDAGGALVDGHESAEVLDGVLIVNGVKSAS